LQNPICKPVNDLAGTPSYWPSARATHQPSYNQPIAYQIPQSPTPPPNVLDTESLLRTVRQEVNSSINGLASEGENLLTQLTDGLGDGPP